MTFKSFKPLFIILLFLSPGLIIAQNFMRGVCGVHAHDMEEMEAMYPNDGKGIESGDRSATINIPIQFHLVANSSGNGRITPNIVLKQLCKLNSDFSNTNIRFYLYNTFRNIDNTAIYSEPGSNGNAIQSRKVTKALNVFITDKADSEGALGTVLGFYSTQGDYIVLTKGEAIKLTNTLSHEMGHFLSLRHTFHGWERDPWSESKHSDTLQIRYTLDGQEIEFMNKTNCSTSADLLCDTPPDYNFGFTSNGCVFNYDVWDFNNDKVLTQKENQMSYFSNCSDFMFTPNQVTRMISNYNSTGRNYLKNNPLPNLDTIVGPATLLNPVQGQQLNVFDGVWFDWEDVPNATHYILEIRNLSSNEYLIVDKSEYYATNLRKNLQYTYDVTPFSFGHFCAPSVSATFKTGSQSTTSTSDLDSQLKMSVYPNPSVIGEPLMIQFETTQMLPVQFQLFDINGRQVYINHTSFSQGKHIHKISSDGYTPGLYILNVLSAKENISYKIILR